MLGSARSKRFMTAEDKRWRRRPLSPRVSGLIVLGGNGSLAGARALQPAKDV